ncbi:MAG: GAF domain-containing protein, partial [Gammaproteobacteria bacterium]|nr:GAF domain-containing protein [Gammaproteobacteria bacterium]
MTASLSGKGEAGENLIGERFDETVMLQRLVDTGNFTNVFQMYFNKMILAFLYKKYEKGYEYFLESNKYIEASLGHFALPKQAFYSALVMLALARTSPDGRKGKLVKLANKQLKKLKKYNKFSPENHEHAVALVEAEKARLLGKEGEAIELYDIAIKKANENGFLNEEALANELAGELFFESGKEKFAKMYFMDAHYCYGKWGAAAKTKDLEERHAGLIKRKYAMGSDTHTRSGATLAESMMTTEATTSGATSLATTSSLDFGTVMKASMAISGEIKLENLLGKLMKNVIENAGAERGLLILDNDGEYVIEAEGEASKDSIKVMQSRLVEESEDLSKAVLNYVARTRENIVLNNAAKEGQFVNDTYIKEKQPKSLLCSPVIHQGKLIGMVYLENNLATGAFTPDRLRVLNLLSSQAAISLENANLYANLEEKVEERTQELRESKKEIDDIMENVSQGLMTIYPDGSISPEYSRKVVDIFERDDLGNSKFGDLFFRKPELQKKVADFIEQMFTNVFMTEKLFEATNPVKEHHFAMVNKEKKEIEKVLEFGFSRIYKTDESGKPIKEVVKLMAVVDDRTEEHEIKKELEQKAEEQASKVEKLYQILQLQPSVFSGFITESSEILGGVYADLNSLGADEAQNKSLLQKCYREVHTLKGNARALNLDSIAKTAHELEDVFDELKEKPDQITEELKERVFSAVSSLKDEVHDGNALFEKILNMQRALQTKSQDVMEEFEERFRKIVEKEQQTTGKAVKFDFVNELPAPLPGPVMIKLRNPLSHIIRNSMSHGIENAEE